MSQHSARAAVMGDIYPWYASPGGPTRQDQLIDEAFEEIRQEMLGNPGHQIDLNFEEARS